MMRKHWYCHRTRVAAIVASFKEINNVMCICPRKKTRHAYICPHKFMVWINIMPIFVFESTYSNNRNDVCLEKDTPSIWFGEMMCWARWIQRYYKDPSSSGVVLLRPYSDPLRSPTAASEAPAQSRGAARTQLLARSGVESWESFRTGSYWPSVRLRKYGYSSLYQVFHSPWWWGL